MPWWKCWVFKKGKFLDPKCSFAGRMLLNFVSLFALDVLASNTTRIVSKLIGNPRIEIKSQVPSLKWQKSLGMFFVDLVRPFVSKHSHLSGSDNGWKWFWKYGECLQSSIMLVLFFLLVRFPVWSFASPFRNKKNGGKKNKPRAPGVISRSQNALEEHPPFPNGPGDPSRSLWVDTLGGRRWIRITSKEDWPKDMGGDGRMVWRVLT